MTFYNYPQHCVGVEEGPQWKWMSLLDGEGHFRPTIRAFQVIMTSEFKHTDK